MQHCKYGLDKTNTLDKLSSSWYCKCFLVAASGVIRVVTLFAYRHVNHLQDWINSVTGLENTEIDPKITGALRSELCKNRITRSEYI